MKTSLGFFFQKNPCRFLQQQKTPPIGFYLGGAARKASTFSYSPSKLKAKKNKNPPSRFYDFFPIFLIFLHSNMTQDVEMKEVAATPSNPLSSPAPSLLQSKKQQNPPVNPNSLDPFLLSYVRIFSFLIVFLIGVKWGCLRFEGDRFSHRDWGVLEGSAPHRPRGPSHDRFEAEAEAFSSLRLHRLRPRPGFGGAFEAFILSSQGKCCELLSLIYIILLWFMKLYWFLKRGIYANTLCGLLKSSGFYLNSVKFNQFSYCLVDW